MNLQGKIALVTAAGQGIGRAAVVAMVEAGARVIATDLRIDLLESLRDEVGVRIERLDVMDKQAIDALLPCLELDVLFNCAGIVHNGDVLQVDDESWSRAFDLNVRSQLWTIQAVLPGMLARGGGSIINMASVCSSLKGIRNRCIYGTSKAAVIGLTKSVAADYVDRGVRCNAVCPGTVDTPSLSDRIATAADPDQARKDFIARQLMGRLAQANEIASLVAYLASDASQFVTGQAWAIDGGFTI